MESGKRGLEALEQFTAAAQERYTRHRQMHDSSVGSDENSNLHMLYFNDFIAYPFKIDVDIRIQPEHWAMAFEKHNIQQVADILCRALFTIDELIKRNAENVLPEEKKTAIMKASKWLMNKSQDPWSYDWQSPWPEFTKEEHDGVCMAFATFTSVYPKPTSNVEVAQNESEFINSMKFLESGPLCIANGAQLVRYLTKLAIPKNDDVFVDAVQFTRRRWSRALRVYVAGPNDEDAMLEIARQLFNKIKVLDFTITGRQFNSFQDVSPVKRVALIRAVAFIMNKTWLNCDPHSFDSANPIHNLFLKPEDISKIENYLNQMHGPQNASTSQSQSDVNVEIPVPATSAQSLTNFLIEENIVEFCPVSVQHMGSQPVVLQSSIVANNDYSVQASIPIIQNMNIPENPVSNGGNINVTQNVANIRGFPPEVWTEAIRIFNLEKEPLHGAGQAGKSLLKNTFSKEDIMNGSLSGRGTVYKLNMDKVQAILDTVLALKASKEINSLSDRKVLEKTIFHDYRNTLAGYYRKELEKQQNNNA